MSSPRKTTTGSPPSICLFHICYEIHPNVVEPIKDLLSTKIERKLEQLFLSVIHLGKTYLFHDIVLVIKEKYIM